LIGKITDNFQIINPGDMDSIHNPSFKTIFPPHSTDRAEPEDPLLISLISSPPPKF